MVNGMNSVLYYGSAAVAALLLGGVTAWCAVGCGMWGSVSCGVWRHYPDYGGSAANPYVRAQAIIEGPMVLQRSEANHPRNRQDDAKVNGRP